MKCRNYIESNKIAEKHFTHGIQKIAGSLLNRNYSINKH